MAPKKAPPNEENVQRVTLVAFVVMEAPDLGLAAQTKDMEMRLDMTPEQTDRVRQLIVELLEQKAHE